MIISKVSTKVFWLIAIALHMLCYLQAWHTGSIYLVDSIDYLSQADNLLQHGSLYAAPWNGPFRFDYFTFRPPVYGVFILLCKTIYASDYLVLLLQSLLSLSTLYGVHKFALSLGFNMGWVRFFLLLMLACYPSQLIHCNFIMSDILFQSLLFWAFYYSYQLLVSATYKVAGLSVLFFVLAMLTKPVAFLLGISLIVVLMFIFYRKHQLKFLLPFIVLPLTYHAYCSYNKHITGYYHYASVTPVFVLKYMAKYTNAQIYGESYADSVQHNIMLQADAQKHFSDRYQLMNHEGMHIIAQHKANFVLFNIKGWFAFMLDPGRFEWVHFLNINEGNYSGLYHVINTQGWVKGILTFIKNAPLLLLFVLMVSFVWNVFISVFLILFFFQKKVAWQLRLWVFLFVAYIIGSTGVLGLSRYRIGIAPLLWMAAMFVVHLYILKRSDQNIQKHAAH